MTNTELDAWIETHIFDRIVLSEYPYMRPGGLTEYEVLTEKAQEQHYENYDYQCVSVQSVRPFNTDIAMAWKVVTQMRKNGFSVGIMDYEGAGWQCRFRHRKDTNIDTWGTGEKVSEAICRSARKAINEEIAHT